MNYVWGANVVRSLLTKAYNDICLTTFHDENLTIITPRNKLPTLLYSIFFYFASSYNVSTVFMNNTTVVFWDLYINYEQ